MNENSVKWFGYLFSFAFLIISCAGTELTQKQVDHAYKGKPVSDILAIAITGNEHNRRSFGPGNQKHGAKTQKIKSSMM